jgi:hypothetical protein
LINFVYQIFFRAAFAVFILIQIILAALCVGFIASRQPFMPPGTLFMLFWFAGIALIGTESYFVFERIRRKEWIYYESKKWIAERQSKNPQQVKRHRAIKKFAPWIPAATVILICILFDQTWALATHLLHPRSGELIGYEIPIPLRWAIRFNDTIPNGDNARSILIVERYGGLLRAGSGLYVGRRPPFSVSTMDFRSAAAAVPNNPTTSARIISTRTLSFADETIICREEVPFSWAGATRSAECFASSGDFSAGFTGNDRDADEFYRVLKSAKHIK